MTKEEALKVLVKMRAWRHWGRGEQNEKDRPEMPEQKEVDEAFNVCIEMLSKYSLPSNLDEAAEDSWAVYEYRESPKGLYSTCYVDGFKAGAEWMAGQGWIDDGSMPTETKQESDTLQGHREWTESKPVLAWDSMYGCLVDWTINGKWVSGQTGRYTGQVCHGIIAWRPIPEYKEKH